MSTGLRVAAVVVVATGFGAVLVAQSACNAFSLPSRECLAEGMAVSESTPSTDDPCQTCLQTRCCDVVGECQRAPGCAAAVKETHACVLDGGRPQVDEPVCTPRLRAVLAADAAVDTYACLRGSCRAECGLPTCRFESDVPSFQNASCDRCIESTCCEPVVACAENRLCKAALACIVSSCQPEIASIFAGAAEPALLLERVACGAPEAIDAGGAAPCVARCLDLFAPAASPDVVTDDREARCSAARVLACGARSGCGAQCSAFFGARGGAASPDGG